MAVIDRALTAKPPSKRYIFDGNGASLALMEIKIRFKRNSALAGLSVYLGKSDNLDCGTRQHKVARQPK